MPARTVFGEHGHAFMRNVLSEYVNMIVLLSAVNIFPLLVCFCRSFHPSGEQKRSASTVFMYLCTNMEQNSNHLSSVNYHGDLITA